ncbi:hypothetical protein HOO54_21415 [Bacillus sp. WMMC1349]|uniref:hypothetical protein n=1 Tax=Bacillus sp. WMMC1349 TaxID=2736254 RepID=UPI0015583336|nr:hypothetical protein [Bacillus sp. WMMC1349]NPC94713.1 hypothetical protein [Bacillus sp. WMMC1349]
MKKYVVIALCTVMVIAGVIFAVIYKNKEESDASHFPLTTQQKTMIKNAKKSGQDLSDVEVDTFTIGQGKRLLDEYFKKHHLHYKVGSKEYIEFLASIGESREYQKKPEFTIIDSYAGVYLSELQKANPLFFKFHLKRSTLDKTIKEIRLEHNK